MLVEDLNGDNKPDFLAGNMGTNTFFKPGMKLYVSDFDQNGNLEPIICFLENGKEYPIADKDELIAQLPYLKKQALKYTDYAQASITDLFSNTQLADAEVSQLQTLETTLYLSTPSGYEKKELPPEIQYAPVYAMTHLSSENTTEGTLFFGGNQFLVKPQFGRYDASQGWQLDYRQENGEWTYKPPKTLAVKGQIRQLEIVPLKAKKKLLIGLNNSALQCLSID